MAESLQVCVHIKSAMGLPKVDLIGGADPFVTCTFDDSTHVAAKTSVKSNTLKPQWDETFTFAVPSGAKILKFNVYDEDTISKNDCIGIAVLPITAIAPGSVAPMRPLNIVPHPTKTSAGLMQVFKEKHTLGTLIVDAALIRPQAVQSAQQGGVVAQIELDVLQAIGLHKPQGRIPSPFVRVSFGLHGSAVAKTLTITKSSSPEWYEHFSFPNSNSGRELVLTVYDKYGKEDVFLGYCTLPVTPASGGRHNLPLQRRPGDLTDVETLGASGPLGELVVRIQALSAEQASILMKQGNLKPDPPTTNSKLPADHTSLSQQAAAAHAAYIAEVVGRVARAPDAPQDNGPIDPISALLGPRPVPPKARKDSSSSSSSSSSDVSKKSLSSPTSHRSPLSTLVNHPVVAPPPPPPPIIIPPTPIVVSPPSKAKTVDHRDVQEAIIMRVESEDEDYGHNAYELRPDAVQLEIVSSQHLNTSDFAVVSVSFGRVNPEVTRTSARRVRNGVAAWNEILVFSIPPTETLLRLEVVDPANDAKLGQYLLNMFADRRLDRWVALVNENRTPTHAQLHIRAHIFNRVHETATKPAKEEDQIHYSARRWRQRNSMAPVMSPKSSQAHRARDKDHQLFKNEMLRRKAEEYEWTQQWADEKQADALEMYHRELLKATIPPSWSEGQKFEGLKVRQRHGEREESALKQYENASFVRQSYTANTRTATVLRASAASPVVSHGPNERNAIFPISIPGTDVASPPRVSQVKLPERIPSLPLSPTAYHPRRAQSTTAHTGGEDLSRAHPYAYFHMEQQRHEHLNTSSSSEADSTKSNQSASNQSSAQSTQSNSKTQTQASARAKQDSPRGSVRGGDIRYVEVYYAGRGRKITPNGARARSRSASAGACTPRSDVSKSRPYDGGLGKSPKSEISRPRSGTPSDLSGGMLGSARGVRSLDRIKVERIGTPLADRPSVRSSGYARPAMPNTILRQQLRGSRT